MPLNEAFVFIKPHAVTDAVKAKVSSMLTAQGLTITGEGTKTAKEIDEQQLIDTHYYAIASKATLLKPDQLNVPEDKFKGKFGEAWQAALSAGKCLNAMDACKTLGVDADGLNAKWAACKKAGDMIKFGGGFYCGSIEGYYIFNGFFMSMRAGYVEKGKSIYYYTVAWDESKLSWEKFRGEVLGPTDPSAAPAGSIRGTIYSSWKSLGLASQPNVGENGVHASASPFEAMAERANWLQRPYTDDKFASALLEAGISSSVIDAWTKDPQVPDASSGKKGSLWDQLEDMDTSACLQKCVENGVAKWHVGGATTSSDSDSKGVSICHTSLLVGIAIGAIAGFTLSKNL